MNDNCWNCGKPTAPVSDYGAGQHEYHCKDCDVRWVTAEYWPESNTWKDDGGYAGYMAYLQRKEVSWREQYKLEADELVDFSKPGAPSTIA